jgi:hypothetical protein
MVKVVVPNEKGRLRELTLSLGEDARSLDRPAWEASLRDFDARFWHGACVHGGSVKLYDATAGEKIAQKRAQEAAEETKREQMAKAFEALEAEKKGGKNGSRNASSVVNNRK